MKEVEFTPRRDELKNLDDGEFPTAQFDPFTDFGHVIDVQDRAGVFFSSYDIAHFVDRSHGRLSALGVVGAPELERKIGGHVAHDEVSKLVVVLAQSLEIRASDDLNDRRVGGCSYVG